MELSPPMPRISLHASLHAAHLLFLPGSPPRGAGSPPGELAGEPAKTWGAGSPSGSSSPLHQCGSPQAEPAAPPAELDPLRVGAGSPGWGPGSPSGGAGSGSRSQRSRRSSPLARQRVHRRPSGLRQRRWVCPSPVGTRELARSCVEAAELCAGLHRHLGRRSTSTSSRDPRELQSRHRGREAVANAWSTPHLDLVRLENRPAQARGANAQLEPARSRARESVCTSSGCAHA